MNNCFLKLKNAIMPGMTTASFSPATLTVGNDRYFIVDLPALDAGPLPVVLRLLLENAVRHMRGAEREAAVAALRDWLRAGCSHAEIAFQPGRVLMHDTTSTPALVDIAAMRDALAEAGADPARLNPCLPVDVSVDHSLAVNAYARPDAARLNIAHEIRLNRERYQFLRWASSALNGVRIHPPGTGIMHTINLEQLATLVQIELREGEPWAVPDMMLGTDSHTPMINGIGVLGWGVGGLEAQTVMFGMPTMLRIPEVIGVELTGALPPGSLATDLALTVTERLRAIGVSGEFVEFFGPGVSGLSAGTRAVVANMAPEYGASTAYFPPDEEALDYLRQTGRDEKALTLARAYLQRNGLWFDPQARPRYTQTLHIALEQIGASAAGPRRPQDRLPLARIPQALAGFAGGTDNLPAHPVAIAAITSCTNTSDLALLMAAGLLARKARARGLRAAPWTKTSLAPGSPAALSYLKRAGLLDDLAAVGFDIVGFGCSTCIGNSGALPERIEQAQRAGAARPVAILSGNRNFPGRVHPDLELGFLMSPPMVIAYALAGDAGLDLMHGPIGRDGQGQPVMLADLWPDEADIQACLKQGLSTHDFAHDFAQAARNPAWHALPAPAGARFPWDPASTILRRPPFAASDAGCLLGHYTAYPLLVLGDDITTDHISPASAIPADSLVADYLEACGENRHELNVFASRRGNWEVMLRAAFYSRTLSNHLAPDAPVAHTRHLPSGELMPIWQAAARYQAEKQSVVLVAGERYGTGSSRDWAAKGQRLLGIRAVLAKSFERIHRSNLIGMGVLPLRLPANWPGLQTGERVEIDAADIQPRATVAVRIWHADGSRSACDATAAVETQLECELLRAGGVIPSILQRALS